MGTFPDVTALEVLTGVIKLNVLSRASASFSRAEDLVRQTRVLATVNRDHPDDCICRFSESLFFVSCN